MNNIEGTPTGNPFAIDYSKIGKTPSGRAWVEKAIHPPGQETGPLRGMPDNESYPSTVLKFRNTTTINAPNSTDLWNVLVLAQPSAEYPYLIWKWADGGTVPTIATIADNANTVTNPGFDFETWDKQVARHRVIYHSVTTELNAPSLADQGMVYCAQQRLENVASVQEEALVGKVPHGAQTQIVEQLPTDPNLLMQQSPGAYKQRAKQGCFTVLGLAQPVNKYVAGNSVTTVYGNTDGFQAWTGVWSLGNRIVPWAGSTARRVNTGVSDNWSSSWVLYKGIAPSATIEVKAIHGHEIQSAIGSGFNLFVEPSADPDTAAMDAYYALRHGMMDGYPASYNFFGSLLAGISSLVPRIVDWLRPAAKAIAPAVGQAISGWGQSSPEPARAKPVAAPRGKTESVDAMLRALESRLANLEVKPAAVRFPVPAPRAKRSASKRPASAPSRPSQSRGRSRMR